MNTPKKRHSHTTFAMVRALHSNGKFSERDIATLLGVPRNTVHAMLTMDPKTPFPRELDGALVEAASTALREAVEAGQRALIASLRETADALEKEIQK